MATLIRCIDEELLNLRRLEVNESLLVALVTYPITSDCLGFEVSESEERYFYDNRFPNFIHQLFAMRKLSIGISIDKILRHANLYSKPDCWLLTAVNLLNLHHDPNDVVFLTSLIRDYFYCERRVASLMEQFCSQNEFDYLKMNCLSRAIVNLPTYLANAKAVEFDEQLDIKHLICNFACAFKTTTPSPNIVKFCAQVLGQFCISGFSKDVVNFILDDIDFRHSSSSDISWPKVISILEARPFEFFFERLLLTSSHPHHAFEILKVYLMQQYEYKKIDMSMRIFRRLLFVRCFSSGIVPRCIFHILYEFSISLPEPPTLIATVDRELGLPLLRLWADATAIQKSSIKQRIYISQALASWVICFRTPLFGSGWRVSDEHALLPDALSGISNHLASPRAEIRSIGMAVGEFIMQHIELDLPNSESELKFDYVDDQCVQLIRPFFDSVLPLGDKSDCDDENSQLVKPEITQGVSTNDMDSDDDPDPVDDRKTNLAPLPRTGKMTKHTPKKPRYLRECLDGMLLSKPEDSQLNVICTSAAAELIYAHPDAARELAVDFTRVLLHTEPPACPDTLNVERDRYDALVAIGITAPKQCAKYLTGEFCRNDCSYGERQTIISALTDIACRLSGLEIKLDLSKTVGGSHQLASPVSVGGKTRRLCSKPPSVTLSQNQFAPVAGDFFFPLVSAIPSLLVSSEQGTFAHQDAGILSSLMAALGTIYACSYLAPAQRKMVPQLCDLLPQLCSHSEPSVRRSSLLTLGTIITTTPPSLLRAEPSIFLEFTSSSSAQGRDSLLSYLKRRKNVETDAECHDLASACCLALLETTNDQLITQSHPEM